MHATPIPFDEFRTAYLHVLSGPRYSPATRSKMDQVLRQFASLEVTSTADFTTAKATDYAIARSARVCANTVRGELTYLRAAVNYAIEERLLDKGPRWRRIWPRKSKRKRKTAHSVEQVRKVLEHLEQRIDTWDGHRLFAAAALAAYTGLRRDEVLWCRVGDIDLRNRIIDVVDWKRLKTEESANPVPIPEELVPALRDWMFRCRSMHLFPRLDRQKPWRGGSKASRPTARLVAAGMAVGVPGFTFQSLRHTFATLGRRRWGISAAAMRDILRHVDIETHEANYLHRIDDLVDAVRHVSYRQV
jgi:integrase